MLESFSKFCIKKHHHHECVTLKTLSRLHFEWMSLIDGQSAFNPGMISGKDLFWEVSHNVFGMKVNVNQMYFGIFPRYITAVAVHYYAYRDFCHKNKVDAGLLLRYLQLQNKKITVTTYWTMSKWFYQ